MGAGEAAGVWEGCRMVRNLKLGCGWRVSPPHPPHTFLTGFALAPSPARPFPTPFRSTGRALSCRSPWRCPAIPPEHRVPLSPSPRAGMQELPAPEQGCPCCPPCWDSHTSFLLSELGSASPAPLQHWRLPLCPSSSAWPPSQEKRDLPRYQI